MTHDAPGVAMNPGTWWLRSGEGILWLLLAGLRLWIAFDKGKAEELFTFGCFLLIATSRMFSISRPGVFLKENKLILVYKSVRYLGPKSVSRIEEDRMGLNIYYRSAWWSTTLPRKDFSEADWEKLIRMVGDWAQQHSVKMEEWAQAERIGGNEV